MCRVFDKELERSRNVIKHKLSELCQEYDEKDIAEWARTSVHMIRKYRNINEQEYHLPTPNWRLLCKELSAMKDPKLLEDQTAGNVMITLVGHGKANGTLDDDTTRILEVCGHLIEAYHAGDKKAYRDSMRDLKQCVTDFDAEGEQMS